MNLSYNIMAQYLLALKFKSKLYVWNMETDGAYKNRINFACLLVVWKFRVIEMEYFNGR